MVDVIGRIWNQHTYYLLLARKLLMLLLSASLGIPATLPQAKPCWLHPSNRTLKDCHLEDECNANSSVAKQRFDHNTPHLHHGSRAHCPNYWLWPSAFCAGDSAVTRLREIIIICVIIHCRLHWCIPTVSRCRSFVRSTAA